MPDKILTCSNCRNPFVYSEYEQQKDQKEAKPTPIYCPICRTIRELEAKYPAKPKIPVV